MNKIRLKLGNLLRSQPVEVGEQNRRYAKMLVSNLIPAKVVLHKIEKESTVPEIKLYARQQLDMLTGSVAFVDYNLFEKVERISCTL